MSEKVEEASRSSRQLSGGFEHSPIRRLQLFYGSTARFHNGFTPTQGMLVVMADFLAVLGIIAFAAVMMGLIWALDRV